MDCGFETIGNATLICHDKGPVLATDPWLVKAAYFGSWSLSHQIPEQQLENVKHCEFIWLSHGHPDHLSMPSLRLLKNKKILIPNHVEGRIATDMMNMGFNITILKDRVWTRLSKRIRVFNIADYNQDAVLLVEIANTLIINLNDAGPRGWLKIIQNIAKRYNSSFLLQLNGYGDADMMNHFTEDGERITPPAAKKYSVGASMASWASIVGATYALPFSSLHRYQRTDSVWANEYVPSLDAYSEGYNSSYNKNNSQFLPAFIRYDCINHRFKEINPTKNPTIALSPEIFGDNWSECLEVGDLDKIKAYFQPISHLAEVMDFINVRVGGEDNIVQLRSRNFNKGIIFEVPRKSLMQCVEHHIFDDLLIGNFMKTTMVGKWKDTLLYPDFSPYVAKYADNGLARSKKELDAYFGQYRKRAPILYFHHQVIQMRNRVLHKTASVVKGHLDKEGRLYSAAEKVYHFLR